MSNANLEKSILATIVYYNLFDYPLTAFEVFLYLVNENNSNKNTELSFEASEFSSVFLLLNGSEYLKKYLKQEKGFYFLKRTPPLSGGENSKEEPFPNFPLSGGLNKDKIPPALFVKGGASKDIVQQRLNRKKLADRKWKKAKKIFWIMQITPFMKTILVSGSLAMGNSKNESDVDLIIIAKKGRIWTVRTFITLLTFILGVRRHNNITKNKICLNHYITDKSLKIPFESLYNAQSYLQLINVYNSEEDKKIFRKFQEENRWIGKYARNYRLAELGGFRGIGRNKILRSVSSLLEIVLSGEFGNYLEKKLAEIQSKRIKKDFLYKKSGGRITIDSNQLEFHPSSREAKIIPEFNKQIKTLGLTEFGEQKDSGLLS